MCDRVAGLVLLLAVLIVILVLFNLRLERDLRRYRSECRMRYAYDEAFNRLEEITKEKQHDFHNRIALLTGICNTAKDLEELKEKQAVIIGEIKQENKYNKLVCKIDNTILAGFFYAKAVELEKQQISLEIDCSASLIHKGEKIFMLTELLGILIDNAAEAVNVRRNLEGTVWVRINESKGLIVEVQNECESELDITHFFEGHFSTKGDGRGLGLSKLKKTAHKEGIEVRVEKHHKDNRCFVVFSLILPN